MKSSLSDSKTPQPASIKADLNKARSASVVVSSLTDSARKALLETLSAILDNRTDIILQENQKDLDRMDDDDPKKDRLRLTPQRLQDLVSGVRAVASLPDPTGTVLRDTTHKNGLSIKLVSVPLGVVGIIYESRPNVTVDVAALCLRSGNVCVLRGGSDAWFSNQVLVNIIREALQSHNLPLEAVTLLPTDRHLVSELLTATDTVDLLIPRGSQSLIDFVRDNARVPVIETGAGVCHTYVTSTANLEKARDIVINAKTSRPSVCNALDTVIVDQAILETFLPMLKNGFAKFAVHVFADERAFNVLNETGYPHLEPAAREDFGREFLSLKCSVKTVAGFEEALAHIRQYSSKHSESIVSEDEALCERFVREVDAAAVYTNASTRFTDGGEFGLGAEIGISTQKIHARGPFALEKLTTEKWIVRGSGQIR